MHGNFILENLLKRLKINYLFLLRAQSFVGKSYSLVAFMSGAENCIQEKSRRIRRRNFIQVSIRNRLESQTQRREHDIKKLFLSFTKTAKIHFLEGAQSSFAVLCNNKTRTEAPCRVINRSSSPLNNPQLQYFHNYRRIFRDFPCNFPLFVQFFITFDRLFKCLGVVWFLGSHAAMMLCFCCSPMPLSAKQFRFYAFMNIAWKEPRWYQHVPLRSANECGKIV